MTKSGRGVWWDVIPINSAGAVVTFMGGVEVEDATIPRWARGRARSIRMLEGYIAERALKGCPDCISAILECPNDLSLQQELKDVTN